MTTRAVWRALPIALALVASAVAAEKGPTVVQTTSTEFEAVEFEGAQYREAIAEAVAARADAIGKWAKLQPALTYCDTKQDTETRIWAAVSTHAEREELLATHAEADKLAFVDVACPRAYTLAAFFAADDHETDKAIRWLERAQKLAPFSSAPHSERGFHFNAAGDRQKALASYRRALDLAERYASSPDDKAMALRGIGWTLVELGDFPGAKQAYDRSLEFDPENSTAKAELAFIAKLETNGSPPPATPAFAPATTPTKPSTAQSKSAATSVPPSDEERVIEYTRLLETQPFHSKAKPMRAWLIDWIAESPDVTVSVCNVLELGEIEHASLLFVQTMFGMASFLLEHPESKDNWDAQNRAGVESALKAYSSILAAQPDARIASMDELLKRQAAGELDAALAPNVARHCTESAEETVAGS